jgi:photosystem II stability/assembly factor-like uncharacterized protein
MILLLTPLPSCSGRTENAGAEISETTLPQLDSLELSGPGEASLLIGTKGKTRDFRFTSDGGATWKSIDSQAIGRVLECALLNGTKGWAVNHDGEVFSSDSGGATWRKVADIKALSSGDFSGAIRIKFVNESVGWLQESLSIWRTNDGGLTWQKKLSVSTPGVKAQPSQMFPIDLDTLVAVGDGQIFLTRDGGNSWKIDALLAEAGSFTDIWFTDKQHGWLSGYYGVPKPFRPFLYATDDGGNSWNEVSTADIGILPESVCFIDHDKGWLAGRKSVFTGQAVPSGGVLLFTTDGGRHWNSTELGSDDPFFDVVRFTDKEHGWLAGRDNLYRTEDGGTTWRRVLTVPAPQR